MVLGKASRHDAWFAFLKLKICKEELGKRFIKYERYKHRDGPGRSKRDIVHAGQEFRFLMLKCDNFILSDLLVVCVFIG